MAFPLAYFLTWTCYGTWLHGDHRESVDMTHNTYLTPGIAPNAVLFTKRARSMKHPVVVLDDQGREVVDRAIREHAAIKGWRISAINVRTNHVHVVVAGIVPPERVLEQFKSWSTRALQSKGLVDSDRPVWTHHGSTRYIWDDSSLRSAIDYVTNWQ